MSITPNGLDYSRVVLRHSSADMQPFIDRAGNTTRIFGTGLANVAVTFVTVMKFSLNEDE
jgi:hypothetical protein